MPRRPRIFFENAHYHIMSRGNDKRPIFTDLADRSHYITLLAAIKDDYGVKIPAFALMTNHVHLYLVTPRANLSEFMFTLNNEFSHLFNKRHGKTGHLFEGRYKYKLIQTDKYSISLARYIHLNPVKAGLAAKPEDYPWSSAADYEGNGSFDFVDSDIVLGALSEDPDKALAKYHEFMADGLLDKDGKQFDKNRNMVLGDREFKKAHSPHPDPSPENP